MTRDSATDARDDKFRLPVEVRSDVTHPPTNRAFAGSETTRSFDRRVFRERMANLDELTWRRQK